MAKPFDATLKELLESSPLDWLPLLGLPPAQHGRLIDADVSTITMQSDKVVLVEEPSPWLLHLEFVSSSKTGRPLHFLRYNVILAERHGLPVHTAVILLRKEAASSDLTGLLRLEAPHGRSHVEYGYQVVRLWEMPLDAVLQGGISTLPLSPLTAVQPEQLPAVIQRMENRLEHEAAKDEAEKLWTATYILMGLRYQEELASQLLQGVRAMEESVTYQAILRKGREEGRTQGEINALRGTLVRQGSKRFGVPGAQVRATIDSLADTGRLERMTERVLEAASWDDLLATP